MKTLWSCFWLGILKWHIAAQRFYRKHGMPANWLNKHKRLAIRELRNLKGDQK